MILRDLASTGLLEAFDTWLRREVIAKHGWTLHCTAQSLGFGDPIVTVGFAEVHSVSQLVGGSGSLQCCRAGIELLPKSPCTPFFFEPA